MRGGRYARAFDREAWAQRANDIRAHVPMSKVVEATFKVPLKKAGTDEWTMLCPYHSESTPSFTVNDAKGFCHCFGCGVHLDAIGLIRREQGLSYTAAIELLEAENGLAHLKASKPVAPAPKAPQREDLDKAARVEKLWKSRVEIKPGSPVDLYLRGRGILPPASYGFGDAAVNGGWPADLAYVPSLWHGEEKVRMPGMIAALRRAGDLVAVHRTYLRITGVGVTKAGTKRDKAMYGDVRGAFIRLADDAERMVGGEGIETSLSAMQLFRRAGLAFGTSGAMQRVEPPFHCTDFIYAADWSRTNKVGEISAWKGAKAFGKGRRIAVKLPAAARDHDKADFNDELRARTSPPAPASVPAGARSTTGGRPPQGAPPRQVLSRPAAPPVVLPPKQRAWSPDVRELDRMEVRERLQDLKRIEREAWLRYAKAGDARDKIARATPVDPAALRRAERELQAAGEAWKVACAATQKAAEGQRRIA